MNYNTQRRPTALNWDSYINEYHPERKSQKPPQVIKDLPDPKPAKAWTPPISTEATDSISVVKSSIECRLMHLEDINLLRIISDFIMPPARLTADIIRDQICNKLSECDANTLKALEVFLSERAVIKNVG